MTASDDVAELTPAARLGVRLARADLGYVAAALAGGVVPRTLAFLQHGVMVAVEAHGFCTRQLGIDIPPLAWDQTLAAAARNTGKFFVDKQRDLPQLTSDVNALADTTREDFTAGWRRKFARAIGIFNPDLSVMLVKSIPVCTSVTIAHHSTAQAPRTDVLRQAGRSAYVLAEGIGQWSRRSDRTRPTRRPPPILTRSGRGAMASPESAMPRRSEASCPPVTFP